MPYCKYCQKEIIWLKEDRKNVPVEQDGRIHTCEAFKISKKSLKHLGRSQLSPEEIEHYEKAANEALKK